MNTYIYDCETYPNFFAIGFLHADTGMYYQFEISDRVDQTYPLLQLLNQFRLDSTVRLCGFNNLSFDYQIIHEIMKSGGQGISAKVLYEIAMSIINWQGTFHQTVPEWEVMIPQIDLFKIHHFDNKSRSTGLKALQFNMRSQSVEDLPYPPGTELEDHQKNVTLGYMFHDITETLRFYMESLDQIRFREQLSAKYGRNFMNHNDTKIGKDYFIMELERQVPGCTRDPMTREIRQTPRSHVSVAKIIFPYIQFSGPEFNSVLNWYKEKNIHENERPSYQVTFGGISFDFGIGGLHGSVNNRTIVADDNHTILDLDVSGFYPSIAIQNQLYPEHLGNLFVKVYKEITEQRRSYKKGTPENAMLKLAGNGVYGDSGNPYSPFFDIQYMLSVTINGQLLLCMLVEQIMRCVSSVQLIQVNTDGLTLRLPNDQLETLRKVTKWWEEYTLMTLEETLYSKMFIRDVNAYIAVGIDGKVKKRKNAYSWVRGPNLSTGELQWYQDQSALIIPMAAEHALLNNCFPHNFIYNHTDIFDFMLRAKASRGSKLVLGDSLELPKVTRYYVSKDGYGLSKIMPPAPGCKKGDYKRANGIDEATFLAVQRANGGSHIWDARIHTKNKSRYDDKRLSIEAGYTVTVANDIRQARFDNINYQYYIDGAMKLIREVDG